MPIKTKRWDDPREDDDGYRLLICRFRPRGVARERETWDAWCAHLGPSVELHADVYGKSGAEPIAFAEYRVRFLREMERQRFWIEGFAARHKAGEVITLLCSSACVDPARCHRTLVKELIEAAARPPETAAARAKSRVVVRRREP